jgi:hypothetical protein
MPLEVFEIETYGVSQGRSATGPGTQIVVYAKTAASGNRNWAQLLFSPSFSGLSGDVHNVGASSPGLQILANFPYADFTRMYDILRSEDPVSLWCEYGAGTTATRPLNYVLIASNSNEIPGEGPADSDSVKQFIRLAFEELPDSPSR